MSKIVMRIGTTIALVFLGLVLVRGADNLPVLEFKSGVLWAGMLGGLFFYSISQFVGAFAWKMVLLIYGKTFPVGRAESQLLVSQIGKYIPGNVAHLFGRLTLARADGLAGSIATAAMMLEFAFLLAAGLFIVSVLVVVSPDLLSKIAASFPAPSITALAILAGVLAITGLILGPIIIWRRAGAPIPTVFQLFLPLVLHLGNFGFLGLSLWCVTMAIDPASTLSILNCTAIFTTAWVAGFIMPGAPGGIGVRDGIIALGLELFIGQGAGLGVAVAHRFLSVLGDFVTFGVGSILRKTY